MPCICLVNRVSRGDRIIVMGDINARLEKNVSMWKGVISAHGEDVENGMVWISYFTRGSL